MSIVERQRQALEQAGGETLKASHFEASPDTHSVRTNPVKRPLDKPQTGLGLRRSNHKPIPRRITPEDAETMRFWHDFGLGYRDIGKAFNCSPGTAHHAVVKRGANKNNRATNVLEIGKSLMRER
jgi:hypothetical protein